MRKISRIFVVAGILCMGAAVSLLLFNLWDSNRAGKRAENVVTQMENTISIPKSKQKRKSRDYILNPNMPMPTKEIDGWNYVGILEIGSYDLKLPVIEELTMSGLKAAPCRYSGSPYTEDLVIGAHNYRSHFGAIRKMRPGEIVIFTDMDGNEFSYEVVSVETLAPEQVEEMKNSEWDLTLFTCNYGGQTRAAIRCVRKGKYKKWK